MEDSNPLTWPPPSSFPAIPIYACDQPCRVSLSLHDADPVSHTSRPQVAGDLLFADDADHTGNRDKETRRTMALTSAGFESMAAQASTTASSRSSTSSRTPASTSNQTFEASRFSLGASLGQRCAYTTAQNHEPCLRRTTSVGAHRDIRAMQAVQVAELNNGVACVEFSRGSARSRSISSGLQCG
ncbi:hypothetical protein K438DRAFT_1931328 [Mycena galopus ATCC 62051]|nr:hypothetical protein K438DRAFT_1931328 [Mycena galopus ATCC 62051]